METLNPSKIKSSPNNRIDAIEQALLDAHQDAVTYSKSSLNRMPEYYMAMKVADYFARHFRNFGYRLEAQVKRTFQESDLWHADIEALLAEPDLRPDGRFDLVLRNNRRERAAHILEFKRGAKTESLMRDIRRLAKVSQHAGRKCLETNYLVLTRKCPQGADTTDAFIRRLSVALGEAGLDDLTVNVVSTEPLEPFLDREHQPIANSAFQVIILEIQA